MVLWAVMMAAVAAEPAQGSARGVWAYGDVSGEYTNSFLAPGNAGRLGAGTAAVVGYGFDVGKTRRIVPTVHGFLGFDSSVERGGIDFALGLDAALSFTNLFQEKYSALRVSPVFRVGHDARPQWAEAGTNTTTQLSFALTHERRFGPVELSYTPAVRHLFSSSRCLRAGLCLVPDWELTQSLFIEGWALPALSFALGAWWTVAWGLPNNVKRAPPIPAYAPPIQSFPPQHLVGGSASVTWAPFSFGGFAASAHYSRAIQWSGVTFSSDVLVGVVSLWFRTDAKLQRNWLER